LVPILQEQIAEQLAQVTSENVEIAAAPRWNHRVCYSSAKVLDVKNIDSVQGDRLQRHARSRPETDVLGGSLPLPVPIELDNKVPMFPSFLLVYDRVGHTLGSERRVARGNLHRRLTGRIVRTAYPKLINLSVPESGRFAR